MSALAKRYARAAFEAMSEKAGAASAESLAQDLQRFLGAYQQSVALQEVLRNPVLAERRDAVLTALLQRLQVAGIAARVVRVLATNERINLLPDVVSEVEAQADAQMGRLRARVRSAVMPSDTQIRRISQALEKRLGRPVAVSVVVEPELLGGLVCQVGDLTYDSSMKRQLELLTERLGAHA